MKNNTKLSAAVLEPEVARKSLTGLVYCPMCTHSVTANIEPGKRGYRVLPNQRCPRCSGSMDAAFVIRADARS
ncbi:MAG: hypothetical protein OHK0021_19440 [Bryobacter sp.]